MMPDIAVLIDYWDVFARGFALTLLCCSIAIVGGVLFGSIAALCTLSRHSILRYTASIYLEVIRNTPFLVQAFFVYFVLPSFGIRLNAIVAGTLALALFAGAYFAEAIRGAILSVPRGQFEAAIAVGMHRLTAMRRIILPQMVGYLLPVLGNQAITVVKESSVLSVITVPELTMATSIVVGSTFDAITAYFIVALLYWITAMGISAGIAKLENATKVRAGLTVHGAQQRNA
jgi:polar amino acid transport system permease protein